MVEPQYVNMMRKEIKRTAACLARQESQDTMSRFWRLQKGKESVLADEAFSNSKQRLNLKTRRRDEQRRKVKKAEEELRSWHEETILNRQRQEEILQRRRAEEEAIRLQQEAEAERIRQEAEAERIRQEAEAERIRQEAEAGRLRQEAEAARQRQWEEAMHHQQEEACHSSNVRYSSNLDPLHSRSRITSQDPYAAQLARYQSTWAGLLAIRRGRGEKQPLLFSQIPWPVLGPTPYHRSELTTERIMRFYSFMLQSQVGGLKALLKAELSKWHPDKFALSELLRVSEEQRSMVEAAARAVSDILTDAISVANEQMTGLQPR
jgi:hypothetical protein